MHQRVPADKCSCGLTRGKIRGLRTPESSRAMDLLIPSLDKECKNNDALNRSWGSWDGRALPEGEFRTGPGVES